MKIMDSIYYSLKRVIRNKKSIFLILILTICCIVMTGALTYKNYLTKNVNDTVNKNLGYRTMIATDLMENEQIDHSDESLQALLLNVEHVIEVYKTEYYHYDTPVLEYKNGYVRLLYSTENILPSNIIGKSITKNDTDVAICPLNFNPYVDSDKYNDLNSFIDGNKLLGTTISIEPNIYKKIDNKIIKTDQKYKKQFKIIGLYDNMVTKDKPYSCFISSKDMKDLYDATKLEANKSDLPMVTLIVDDVKNVDYVLDVVRNMGFDVDIQSYIKYDYVNKVYSICNTIILVSCISALLLVIFYIKKMNTNNLKYTGLQKTFGYNHKNVQILSFVQLFIMILISFLISLTIIEIVYWFIKIHYKSYFMTSLNIFSHDMINYFPGLVMIIIIPILINGYFLYRLGKKSIIQLLKGK